MSALYLEIYDEVECAGLFHAPLETLVALFSYKHSRAEMRVVFHTVPKQEPNFVINIADLNYEMCRELPVSATLCRLPVVIIEEDSTCLAGLCGVVRQIFKTANPMHPLLGLKQNCLYACAESSKWTRYCEVDIIKSTKAVFTTDEPIIPNDLIRYEVHMRQPSRMHNIQKYKQNLNKRVTKTESDRIVLDVSHTYAEGPESSIADIILFACLHLIMKRLQGETFSDLIPLTTKWHETMLEMEETQIALSIFGPISQPFLGGPVNYVQPDTQIPPVSLYKSDPRRYKPRQSTFTKQEDIEASLDTVRDIDLDMIERGPFADEIAFDWDTVPWDAQPASGGLPHKRLNRKTQQLEGMSRAVLKIARQGDIVVDFCAGSGHLGLILAHFLPRCTIILIENKTESLDRARHRAAKMHLNNILFCQSNLDYFIKNFTIGVSLHACGVATDLVMATCIEREAAFICCPCCYGAVQPNHMIKYPRSERFKETLVNERQYLIIGHAADQVHDSANLKTEQGFICMDIIDGDRCLNARERGYSVQLYKLYPTNCTPKNNLLIGVPPSRSN